jgi:DNA polymerase-1
VPEDELEAVREGLRSRMQEVARLEVPLTVELGVGENWDRAH